VTVGNLGGPSNGTVTVSDTPPTGLTVTGLSGTGWTCSVGMLNCQRSDGLAPGQNYPPITVTVNVASNAPSNVTQIATESGGGDPNSHTASDPTTITLPPDLTIAKTHAGQFRPGQTGATYTITVSNVGAGPTNSLVTASDTLPAGLTATGLIGTGWTCTLGTLTCQRSDVLFAGSSYPPIVLTVDVSSTPPSSVTNTATVPGGADSNPGNNTANDLTFFLPALRFIPVTPCRVADTRNAPGTFGGPSLTGGITRAFPVPSSSCSIPTTAKAYSLNVTVVPHGFLDYLTLWPTGTAQPFVSTLNAYDGQVTANAAIVPAGTSGNINAFATNDTDLILDINGYFLDTTLNSALTFYPLAPCRVADTRNPNGPLGGPILTGGVARSFPIKSSSCNIPMNAQAYVLNATVVPSGFLDYLTLWPTGVTRPFVSTLNAYDGQVTANMAIVPGDPTSGSIDAYATQNTHLILDITGYFAAPSGGGFSFFALPPCRVVDTRLPNGPLGGPIMIGGSSRIFPIISGPCGVPTGSQAFTMHATVVPSGPLGYLTVWPAGVAQPLVSTLNAYDGQVHVQLADRSSRWRSR
jgi:uncharacterized repeat protein (TIGR01451 family)